MKEELLHFIWKYKLFSHNDLKSTRGSNITLIHTGTHNTNQGPDFSFASISIDQLTLHGDIELHCKTSDWNSHKHDSDPSYQNVILHVVYQHDSETATPHIPILELKDYLSAELLHSYQNLFQNRSTFIPCEENFAASLSGIHSIHFYEKLYVEKLWYNTQKIHTLYNSLLQNWEHVLFVRLAYCFGLTVNAEIFEQLAKNIPFAIVQKASQNQVALEALLLGKANLLSHKNSYAQELQHEFYYLKNKFQLNDCYFQPKFLRLRPANFPTIRLVQLAHMYHSIPSVFSSIISCKSLEAFYHLMENIGVSAFWKTHYTFETESNFSEKKLTKDFINLLILNTFLPVQFAYLQSVDKNTDHILEIAMNLKPEHNSIIKQFQNLGISVQNAHETQALLQLHKHYCKPKQCLSCEIAYKILHSKTEL